jgi:predicted TIM-barrel fold metal-dependent hydrolase
MAAQENLLAGNPQTTFVIAHVGSYAENLAQVARWLDRFPNMNVDIAARIAELGRQPYTARAFLRQYQDRVLYGSDYGPGWKSWPIDFRFLETFGESFRYDDAPLPLQGRWSICGVGLEDVALEKIYSGNAERLLGLVGA